MSPAMDEEAKEAIREALAFLNRIEGHGYGGEAEFENVRRGLQIALPRGPNDAEIAHRALVALNEYRAKGGYSLDEIKTELGIE